MIDSNNSVESSIEATERREREREAWFVAGMQFRQYVAAILLVLPEPSLCRVVRRIGSDCTRMGLSMPWTLSMNPLSNGHECVRMLDRDLHEPSFLPTLGYVIDCERLLTLRSQVALIVAEEALHLLGARRDPERDARDAASRREAPDL